MKRNENIYVTARAVITKKGQVLLPCDPRTPSSQYYDLGGDLHYLPSRHVDYQELAREAITREMRGEMGCETEILNLSGILEHFYSFSRDKARRRHTYETNMILEVKLIDIKTKTEIRQTEKHVKLDCFGLKKPKNINFVQRQLKLLILQGLNNRRNEKFFASTII